MENLSKLDNQRVENAINFSKNIHLHVTELIGVIRKQDVEISQAKDKIKELNELIESIRP